MRAIAAIVLCGALAGCGTTRDLRQGAEIAEAGKNYMTAMQTLADFALEKRVDFLAKQLAEERAEAPGSAPVLKGSLEKGIKLSRDYARLIGLFKVQSKLLWDYFDALDRLVKEPVAEQYSGAFKELADGLNAVGKSLEMENVRVGADQKAALGGLAGTVATAIHAKAVADILRKDATMIAEQVELQKQVLEQFSGSIEFNARLEQSALYNARVLQPYLADAGKGTKAALPSDWRNNLGIVIKDAATAQELANAKSTARKMQSAWRDFLAGKSNSADLLGDAKMLNSALGDAKKLHENRNQAVAP